MDYMEFLVENWLWFLVGGIILLMTLIGYIADKTDFGRRNILKKEKNKKVSKKEKKESKANQQLIETLNEEPKPEVQMTLATDSILEEPVMQEEQTATESLEDLNAPFGDVTFDMSENSVEEVNPEPIEVLNNSFDDLQFDAPIEDEPTSTEPIEDLNVPFGDVTFDVPENGIEEVVEEQPSEELKLDEVNTPSIELPDLDSIVTEEDDTDDVWKF